MEVGKKTKKMTVRAELMWWTVKKTKEMVAVKWWHWSRWWVGSALTDLDICLILAIAVGRTKIIKQRLVTKPTSDFRVLTSPPTYFPSHFSFPQVFTFLNYLPLFVLGQGSIQSDIFHSGFLVVTLYLRQKIFFQSILIEYKRNYNS